MNKLLTIAIFLLFISCKNNETQPTDPKDDTTTDNQVDASVIKIWNDYVTKNPEAETIERPEAWFFHNNEKDANRLGKLVAEGKKQAGSGLYVWYEEAGAPLPAVGTKNIITNFKGKALAIIETTKVDTIPFNQITASYAALDMGTERNALEQWKKAHWDFFTTALAESGQKPTKEILVVCEYFKTVWVEK